MTTKVRIASAIALFCAAAVAGVVAGPPVATDDFYETAAGDNLSVDAPGVLDNDSDPDMDPLTVGLLVNDPVSGGIVNLFDDGSFEYEPPDGFIGTDSFTYLAFDGTEFSNPGTVFVEVAGTPGLSTFLSQTDFLNAVSALGFDTTLESFEDETVWGSVRTTIVGGTFSAPAITSLGVEWTPNNEDSGVTTGNGPARSGSWGFYEVPHGNYLTGIDCLVPGNCTDGFIMTSSPRIHGVGMWITGFFGSKIELILDGARGVDFGNDAGVDNSHKFFGVFDPDGFHSLEIHELEGTAEDQKFIWADDFTFATAPGIWLTAIPGPGPFEITLQWLGGVGGPPGFSIFRSSEAATVLDPIHELGQTTGRVWIDDPPAGDIHFFRVVEP